MADGFIGPRLLPAAALPTTAGVDGLCFAAAGRVWRGGGGKTTRAAAIA